MWYPLIDSVNMICRKTQINLAQDLFHILHPEVTIFKQKFPFFTTVLCSVLFQVSGQDFHHYVSFHVSLEFRCSVGIYH